MKRILTTGRLYLRELTMNDMDDLAEVFSDSKAMEYYPAPFNEDKIRRWIQWCMDSYQSRGFGLWAVVLKHNDECIGDCGISMQEIDGKGLPEIGYHIKPKYSRKGYATEAAIAVKQYGTEKLGFQKVYSYMHLENKASRRVAEKCGMIFIKQFKKNGVPQVLYGV